jgi:hypothetical protein
MNVNFLAMTFAAAPVLAANITAQFSNAIIKRVAQYPFIYKWNYLIGIAIWILIFGTLDVLLLICIVYATGSMLSGYYPKNMDGLFLGIIGRSIFFLSTPIALVFGLIHFLSRARSYARNSSSSGETVIAPGAQLIIVAAVALALVILFVHVTDWDWLKVALFNSFATSSLNNYEIV